MSAAFGSFSDGFGRFRTVFGSFRTVSDHFRTVSDRFGTFRVVSDRFRIVFERFSNRFGRFWYAFGPFSDDSTQNFKISNFNWPGLGPVRAVPSVRAVPPSPGQLKFEIFGKIDEKSKRKQKRKKKGFSLAKVSETSLVCSSR